MSVSLLQTFRDLDQHTKELLADITSPLLLSFAALSISHNKCGTERLSAEHIVACLEAAGVDVNKTSVSRALARASGRVSVATGLNNENQYRLMTKGKRDIAPYLGGGGLTVVRIEGNSPRTARSRLGELLAGLKGTVRICDPYYGIRTLDSLDHIPKACAVRFLTARTNEGGRNLTGALRDFKKERSNVEFRLVNNPSEIHDRYVLTAQQLLLVGHGLKDIGGKESFVVSLDKNLAAGLIAQTRSVFDTRWRTATIL